MFTSQPLPRQCNRRVFAGPRPRVFLRISCSQDRQRDWLELPNAPWGGAAHLFAGTLPYSGKVRAVFADAEDQAHLVEALDAVSRRFGGTARRWRFDHMPGPFPREPYPATVDVVRGGSAAAHVAFRGNRYGVLPGLTGTTVLDHYRLGSQTLEIVSRSGASLTTIGLPRQGAGMLVRSPEEQAALEAAVLDSLTSAPPCRGRDHRRDHRPPGPDARAAAQALRGVNADEVHVDLARYAELA